MPWIRKSQLLELLEQERAYNRELVGELGRMSQALVDARDHEARAVIAAHEHEAQTLQKERERADVRVDSLLGFIMKPDEALLYARARELEMLAAEDAAAVRVTGGGEFDEPSRDQAAREAAAMAATRELAKRGVTAVEIDDAAGGP